MALALLVAVVPGAVRFSDRDSDQRVETEAERTVDDADEIVDEAAEALPVLSAGDLAGRSNAVDLLPQTIDLTGGSDPETDAESSSTTEAGATSTTDADGSADGEGEGGGGDDDTTATTDPGSTATTPTTAPGTTTTVRSSPLGTAPGTGQRTLYVDPGRGSFSNPGTEDRPFRRPVEALTKAQPGDTIYLRAGTYDTSVHSGFNITRSGTADRWIRIAPYPGERVELVAGGEYGSGFEILGASYIELSGFVIRGRSDSVHGSGVFVKDGSHDVRIVGNQISNFGGAGISVIAGSRITIEGNDVRNNAHRSFYQGSGISLYKMSGPLADGFSNVVRGNYVVNNRNDVPHHQAGRPTDGNCIIMDRNDESNYRGWTLIENNVCAQNGGRGIHSYRSSYIEARNNTLYHNLQTEGILHGRGEMTVGEARDVYFYNNLVINRPGIASFIDNRNTNSRFANNLVLSGPPPGEGNRLLPSGVDLFSSTALGGPVGQFRPLGSAGLSGTADGSKQASNDYTGRRRPGTGAVGAFEP